MKPIYPQPNSKCLEIFCECHIFISRNPPYLVHSAARTVMRETTPFYSSCHPSHKANNRTDSDDDWSAINLQNEVYVEVLTDLPPRILRCTEIDSRASRWLCICCTLTSISGGTRGQWGQLPPQNIRRRGIAPMIARSHDSDTASPLY